MRHTDQDQYAAFFSPLFPKAFLLRPSLKILLPHFAADRLLSAFPFTQAAQRDTRMPCKGLPAHTELLTIDEDALGLSIEKEAVVIVYEIRLRNTIELCQPICDLWLNVLSHPFLQRLVDVMRQSHPVSRFSLYQSLAVPAPAEPVRHIPDFLVSAILPIKLSCLQNLPRGAQYETMYIEGCIPHMRIPRTGKDI